MLKQTSPTYIGQLLALCMPGGSLRCIDLPWNVRLVTLFPVAVLLLMTTMAHSATYCRQRDLLE